MAEAERFLSNTEKYAGPIFTVDQRQVALSDGSHTTRDIVRHGLAVGVLPLLDADHAILVRQWRAATDDFALEIPAGKVDDRDHGDVDQATHAAALRELNEEIRCEPTALHRFAFAYEAIGFTDSKIALYLAEQVTPVDQELPRDHGESIDIVTMSFEELTALFQSGQLNDLKTMTAYLYWAQWRAAHGK
ncbi:NUDIX hydrolase [Leuconostocaceae bacterium ESL0958]|nr:NUDIX hydrolase [Leuconostocaceae bacterium ESL0958]